MILGNRALFVLTVSVSAVLAGCGGGGTGPGSPTTSSPTSTPATMTPTTKPTATATPTPLPTIPPTPQPSGPALAVPARPLTAGDTFTYTGNAVESFVYYGTTPDPNATPTATPPPGGTVTSGNTPVPSGAVAYSIAQSITDVGPSPFASATPFDLRTVETDASANQTIRVTTDTFLADGAYNATYSGLYTYGYTSSDSNGQVITQTLTGVPGTASAPNGLIDTLPETGGAAWTNTGALTLAESESDGFTANRTVATNGTYVETDLYPQTSQYTPAPAPLTATLTENADGSGVYNAPFGGPPNQEFTYSAPANGEITILAGDGTPQNSITYIVPTWYTLPLYSEYDHDDGAIALPSGCPTAYGSQGNGIEEKFTKVDTVAGTLETFDQITFVVGGYAVCTKLQDVTQVFYDYSGQGGEDPIGVDITGGTNPAEVITLTSLVGLTATSETPAFRTSLADAKASTVRAATVRTNFLALVERRRLERRHRAVLHLRSLHIVRFHR